MSIPEKKKRERRERKRKVEKRPERRETKVVREMVSKDNQKFVAMFAIDWRGAGGNCDNGGIAGGGYCVGNVPVECGRLASENGLGAGGIADGGICTGKGGGQGTVCC